VVDLYRTVIIEATRPEDLHAYLNAGMLRRLWSYLWLPPEVRHMWQAQFADLAAIDPLAASGTGLEPLPMPAFREVPVARGHAVYVPAVLPRLPLDHALGRVRLPIHLNWSQPGREFDLANRRQRARVYEIVLREGTPKDILAYVDGALLADLWPDLTLPSPVRCEWQPLIGELAGPAR
jgi:hypothetical protein